jgi:hypothetical protein
LEVTMNTENLITGNVQDVHVLLESLAATDVDVADRDEVAVFLAELAKMRGWLDHREVQASRRLSALAAAGQAEPAEAMLGRAGRRSNRDAAAVTERDRVCTALPDFEAALAEGTVSAGHVDALANATRRLAPDVVDAVMEHAAPLLSAATASTVDAFRRDCADLVRHVVATSAGSDSDDLDRQYAAASVKRWVDRTTGMHHTMLSVDPLTDARIWTSVNSSLGRLRRQQGNGAAKVPWQRLQVDAFVDAITRPAVTGPPVTGPAVTEPVTGSGDHTHECCGCEPRGPDLHVLLDYDTYLHGAHERSICETDDGTPLPVSTLRRLACEANIIPIVLGSTGEVLDAGRSARTVTRGQRRALRAMHRTCVGRDCQVPFSDCAIHHVGWWTRDLGPTDISNLVPLCDRDHHLVHEGGWILSMTADRVVTWTRPDGTVHWTGSCIDRAPGGVAAARPTDPVETRSRDGT